MAETQNIFEDDAKLIELCHRFIDTRERLKHEALKDPSRRPTVQNLAKELNLTVDDTLELQDFADNHLGEFELTYIQERSVQHDFDGRRDTDYPI